MDAQKIAQRLYESFDNDDLCEHPEIVDAVEDLADEYEDLKTENAKLMELVRDMWRDGMCDCDEQYTCAKCCEYHYHERMSELGIEADDD